MSLPTTSPGGNDEANSPADWTARSGESPSGEGTVGVSIGTKKETETERRRGISPARGAPESVWSSTRSTANWRARRAPGCWEQSGRSRRGAGQRARGRKERTQLAIRSEGGWKADPF